MANSHHQISTLVYAVNKFLNNGCELVLPIPMMSTLNGGASLTMDVEYYSRNGNGTLAHSEAFNLAKETSREDVKSLSCNRMALASESVWA